MSDLKFWTPPTKVINTDIKGLMGQKVIYRSWEGTDYSGIIAGVDPYVGISIVEEENRSKILYCIHGPFDPAYRKVFFHDTSSWADKARKQWTLRYPAVVEALHHMLDSGSIVYEEELDNACSEAGSPVSGAGMSNPCPFGV